MTSSYLMALLCCFPLVIAHKDMHIYPLTGPHIGGVQHPSTPSNLYVLASTCELHVSVGWQGCQRVTLSFKVKTVLPPTPQHILFASPMILSSTAPHWGFCFAHWDILGRSIDHRMVGIRGL